MKTKKRKNEKTYIDAQGKVYPLRIIFRVKKEKPIENFLKIRYILGWGTHIRIFLKNNKDFEIYTVNMGYMDERLPSELFLLIDKGLTVNMKCVTGYQKITLKNNPLKIVKIKITLRGGKRLTVTKKHVPDFLDLLPAFPRIKPKTEKCFLRRCFNK